MSMFGTKFASSSTTAAGTRTVVSSGGSGGASPGGGNGRRSPGGSSDMSSSLDLCKLLNAGGSTSPVIDEDGRGLAFQMALKCADLGHLTSSKAVHRK